MFFVTPCARQGVCHHPGIRKKNPLEKNKVSEALSLNACFKERFESLGFGSHPVIVCLVGINDIAP